MEFPETLAREVARNCSGWTEWREAVAWEMYSHRWDELDAWQKADVVFVADKLAALARKLPEVNECT